MRLSTLVMVLAQEKGKIQVKRKEDGKPTWVSPKTLEEHPERYEAPGGDPYRTTGLPPESPKAPKEKKPSKSKEKARRKKLIRDRQEQEKERQEQETKEEQEQEKQKFAPETSKTQDTKELIQWYLYDFEGEERPDSGKPEPEKGKKPKLTQRDIENLPRPGKDGCGAGTIRKTFVNKGTGEKFVRCRELTEEEQRGRDNAMQFLEKDPFEEKPEFAKQWQKQTGRKWDWKKEKARMVKELERKHGDDPWWEQVKLDYGLA